MDSGHVYDGLGQEWMQMIIINNFSGFDNTESRADLRRGPFPGLGYTDRNGTGAVIAGKSISLRCRDTDLPVLRKICYDFSRRTFRNIALTAA